MALSISDQYMVDAINTHGQQSKSVSDFTNLSLGNPPDKTIRDSIVIGSIPIRAGSTIFLQNL